MTERKDSIQNVGIIGAGGYVGARFVNILRGHPTVQGIGIVRSAKALARLSNAPMEVRVVNTSKTSELAQALADCETVVNATLGDLSRILPETQTAYEAARQSGCKLFIHVSSAVVFGRAESPELDDDSPPDLSNWNLYARSKGEAEVFLRGALKDTAMRIVVLRPGLIWGPGTRWARNVADQLLHGSVCLSNAGQGIANLVYVDNLVNMILAVHNHPNGPSGFYNVGDSGTVTWSQFYTALASGLGYPSTAIQTWPDARLAFSPMLVVEWCLQRKSLYREAKWLLSRLGGSTRVLAKRALQGERLPPDLLTTVRKSPPRLTR